MRVGGTTGASGAAGTSAARPTSPRTVPASWTVFVRQVVVLTRLRWRALIGWAVAAGIVVLMERRNAPWEAGFSPLGFGFVLGAVWGLAVWSEESPQQRMYHRTLPVGRRRHDLLRVAAGGVWLVLLFALFLLALSVVWQAKYDALPYPAPELPGRYWLNVVLLPLMAYLAAAAGGMALERPGTWFVLVVGALVGLLRLAEWKGVEALRVPLAFLLAGDYSVSAAAFGTLSYVPSIGGLGPPDRWVWVALVWLALAGAALLLATGVRRDVR